MHPLSTVTEMQSEVANTNQGLIELQNIGNVITSWFTLPKPYKSTPTNCRKEMEKRKRATQFNLAHLFNLKLNK